GGIGVFVAYLGFKNANIINFSASAGNIVSINGVSPAEATAKTFENGVFSVGANGGGIGVFVAYLGFKNANIINFSASAG
ncbi:hypothetical protein ACXWN7_10320, partial [Streptococcus pyogenes]